MPIELSTLVELTKLLQRIQEMKRPVGIDIQFNGSKFHWTVKASSISADQLEAMLSGPDKG